MSSNNWDSIGEFTGLAINSSRTAVLEHASVGISAMHTLRRPMRPCVSDEDRLEMVFSKYGNSDRKLSIVKKTFAC